MAISVLSGSPQAATPVYNKMLFKVSGSLTSGANYRYVCDVKDAAGTTTLARLKCDKLPTTNYGFFDVSRVVETLMAPTVPTLTQAGFADHAGFYSGYRLTFMEEYGSTPVVQTGTTTNVTGNVAFAGNLEQLELADWSGGIYFPSGAIANGVTRMLTTPTSRTVYSNGYGWLAIGQFNSAVNNIYFQYWQAGASGFSRQFEVSASGVTSANMIRFGIGPMNLKALTSAQCSDGQAGSVNFPSNEGDYYDVYFAKSGNITIRQRYVIGPCQRFNSIPVHFVNKYGGIDSYTFTLKNRKRANVQRDTFGYNTDVYATLTYDKVWAGSFDYVYALNSDWLTDAESEWLIELVRSGQVWLELDGQLVEAVVNANQYQFVTRRNDQLQQLQIEIAVAYKNNIL
jgi:hypothetical protein